MSKKLKYDFIIVGAGFAGATCARLLTDKGYKCLIIEERPFVSGNAVSEKQHGIDIHYFGGHILHTNNEKVWDFLNDYGEIKEWRYPIYTWNDGKIYKSTYNMDIVKDLFSVAWVYEAHNKLKTDFIDKVDIKTVEDFSLKYFGQKIYDNVIKGFYEKLYNKKCSEITYNCMLEYKNGTNPILSYKTSFYNDVYQGVPEKGYVTLVENILGDDIDILLQTNFLENKEKYMKLAKYVIYTAELDKFFNYCIGPLSWVSASFELNNESDKTVNLTGTPIVNFSSENPNWYRMTEHKWLTPWRIGEEDYNTHTYVTYEYFKEWEPGEECFYPYYTEQSIALYSRYIKRLHQQYPNVILCGRKALYNNMHICEVIEYAMKLVDKITNQYKT